MMHWRGRVYQLRLACCSKRSWEQHKIRSTLITLLLGSCMLVMLHYLIVSEAMDEAVYFSSLSLPEDPHLEPLQGITRVEPLPVSGTPRMPKRIHQTWKTDHIPQSMTAWIRSWTNNHPDWEYWLWTDDSARQLIRERFPSLLPTYDAYPTNIQRADALRYVVLHEFGGVYADLDMESVKPLDPLILRYACLVGQEPYVHPIMDTNTHSLVINAFMACRQQHPFLKAAVDALPRFAHMWSLLDSTGPHFLTYVYGEYMRDHPDHNQPLHVNSTYLAPAEYFYPNMDPDKFGYVYKKCQGYDALSALQRRACQSLKKTKPVAARRSLAFTVHHWIHTYLSAKVSLRRPVPIHDIVPHVKIYSTPS